MSRKLRVQCAPLALVLRAMCIACAPLLLAMSPSARASEARGAHPYAAPVAEAAQRFGIPEAWIWRVMYVESRGKSRAVSRAGAMGLMQIMPGTWAVLSARHRLGSDPFDARANILAGAAYLRAMWDRYRDISLMLAAYNAGPGRADAYAAGRRGLPAETIAYVAQIAPSLGASDAAPPASAPTPKALDWRGASLFNVQPERSAAAPGVPEQLPDGGAFPAPPVAASHPGAALFVPLSGRDR